MKHTKYKDDEELRKAFPNLGKALQPGRSSANFVLPSPAFANRALKWWSRDSARDD
jgi:hypothetical protein